MAGQNIFSLGNVAAFITICAAIAGAAFAVGHIAGKLDGREEVFKERLDIVRNTAQNAVKEIKQAQALVRIEAQRGEIPADERGKRSFTFDFPVKHAWIELFDNIHLADRANVTSITGKVVEVQVSAKSPDQDGSAALVFRVWASSY